MKLILLKIFGHIIIVIEKSYAIMLFVTNSILNSLTKNSDISEQKLTKISHLLLGIFLFTVSVLGISAISRAASETPSDVYNKIVDQALSDMDESEANGGTRRQSCVIWMDANALLSQKFPTVPQHQVIKDYNSQCYRLGVGDPPINSCAQYFLRKEANAYRFKSDLVDKPASVSGQIKLVEESTSLLGVKLTDFTITLRSDSMFEPCFLTFSSDDQPSNSGKYIPLSRQRASNLRAGQMLEATCKYLSDPYFGLSFNHCLISR